MTKFVDCILAQRQKPGSDDAMAQNAWSNGGAGVSPLWLVGASRRRRSVNCASAQIGLATMTLLAPANACAVSIAGSAPALHLAAGLIGGHVEGRSSVAAADLARRSIALLIRALCWPC
ncbi:hypothetical protein MJ579_23680 [Klebsiella pneumoniae]|nr:hypothetical protein MJ579_23680 [Klebsiella pneumoniae]